MVSACTSQSAPDTETLPSHLYIHVYILNADIPDISLVPGINIARLNIPPLWH